MPKVEIAIAAVRRRLDDLFSEVPGKQIESVVVSDYGTPEVIFDIVLDC